MIEFEVKDISIHDVLPVEKTEAIKKTLAAMPTLAWRARSLKEYLRGVEIGLLSGYASWKEYEHRATKMDKWLANRGVPYLRASLAKIIDNADKPLTTKTFVRSLVQLHFEQVLDQVSA